MSLTYFLVKINSPFFKYQSGSSRSTWRIGRGAFLEQLGAYQLLILIAVDVRYRELCACATYCEVGVVEL